MRRYLTFSLLLAAAAFSLPARPSDEALSGYLADAETLVERYLAAFNARDPVALSALYSENGLVIPPEGVPVRGRDAIKDYWSRSGRRGLIFHMMEKDICGDAGFFVGSYEARQPTLGELNPADGTTRTILRHEPEHGNFVLCVKRGKNGAWQIATDMWNANPQFGYVPAVMRFKQESR